MGILTVAVTVVLALGLVFVLVAAPAVLRRRRARHVATCSEPLFFSLYAPPERVKPGFARKIPEKT